MCREMLLLCLAAVLVGQLGYGARILGVFPITSISHQVVYRALMMELARRGHQLVVITPDPVDDANYTQVDVSFLYEYYHKKLDLTATKQDGMSPYDMMLVLMLACEYFCEKLMGHEPVRDLISPNSTEQFDLVFVEWLTLPSMYAFAHRFSAPLIGISSLSAHSVGYDAAGNPTNPSYIPQVFMPYTDKMTFFERIDNFLFTLRQSHLFYNTMLPRFQAIADRYFGPSTPSLYELHFNVSMLFVNCDSNFHPPRPDVPAVVHIPGLHISSPKTLPQDIDKFLNSSPRGAVYFSLGSNVRSDRLNAATRQMLVDAFAALDEYHILWKWESDKLPGQPANVMVHKWMPQQDILRHSKVKVFITQGGLQSTQEAIHCGVPMIVIPFVADQDYNAKRIVEKGIGVKLELSQLNTDVLLEALRRVLHDQSYQNNVQRMSAIMRDQQMSPLERAVWWTEYVLRHKGATHLRTTSVDLPWYQYLLLDVLAFLVATTLLVALLLWRTAKFLNTRIINTRKIKTK